MIILGIDPGTATTGYSILKKEKSQVRLLDYGCIRTAAGLAAHIRLNQIAQDIETLIDKWKPHKLSIEKLFFQKNVKTAMSVSEARGVIIQKCTEKGLEMAEYTPLEIKSAICGYGKADKKMVQEMVKITLGLQVVPKPDDAADAIAAAICLSNSLALESRLR